MKRHGFLLALLWGVLSCGSPSETPNVASKGEPKKERRILYYDSAASSRTATWTGGRWNRT